MGSYYLTALVLVLAIPIGTIALLAGTFVWARDVVERAPLPGTIGVACTLVAAANLLVARACGTGINRPIIAMAVADDACRRSGLLALEVVLLLAVGTAVAVRLRDVRR